MKDVGYWLKDKQGNIKWTCVQYDAGAGNHIGLKLDMLLNFEESVATVIENMSDEDIEYVQSTPEDETIKLYSAFGMGVRNGLGLWVPDNPHVGTEHPDDYSFKIITEVWKRINETQKTSNVLNLND